MWALLALAALAADPGVVVVARKGSPAAALGPDVLARLYSGGRSDTRVRLVDYGADVPVRDAFYEAVTGRDGRQMHAFWMQFVFSGSGRGPAWVRDAADMTALLREDGDAVGYLWETEVPGDLVVLWHVSATP
ncbi:MAG: hypothetical protein ACOZNI_10785 [Myxococcota bacterium]